MILLNFNSRNDNFGDQLISYLLYKELQKKASVYYLTNKPDIINAHPLRLRSAFTSIIKNRLRGEKVILIDPPCARVYVQNLSKPDIKKRFIEFILNLIISERHVLGISVDSRIDINEFKIYQSIGIRDHSSLKYIKSKLSYASFTPDIACLLPIKKPKYSGNKILLSFRKITPDNNYSSEYAEQINNVLPKIINLLNPDKKNLVLYSQVDEDDEYNLELAKKFGSSEKIQKIEKQKKENYYPELFQDTQLVISNRLHVLLPAMINGVLAIPLISSSHKKIIDLLMTYKLDNTIIYIDSETDIEQKINSLLVNKKALLADQYEKLKLLNTELSSYIAQLAKDC